MKKTLWVFSLVIMLFSQIITPFTYATGDIIPVEEVVVEKLVTPVEDTASEDEVTTWDAVAEQTEGKVQQGTDFSVGGGDKSNLVNQQWISWDNAQIGSWNSEDNHDAAPVEVQSWTTVEVNSWNITKLSWDNENLKEEQVEEKIGNWSWEESKTWLFETIKNFLWLWETKEEDKEQKNYEYETQVITWEAEYDDVKVEVYADTWLFYSWTELVIQAVTGDMYEWVKEVLSWQLENLAEEEQTVVAFDISFIYSWEEVQPLTWTVQVSFNYENNEDLKAAEENEEQEVKVYHLNDKDDEWEKIEEITWAKLEEVVVNEEKREEVNAVVVEADSFSVYTIIVKNISDVIIQNYNQNYEDLDLYFVDAVWTISYYTIMDRNMWATEVYNKKMWEEVNKNSYGYFYQWWNNYWFSSNGYPKVKSSEKVPYVNWKNKIPSSFADSMRRTWAPWYEESFECYNFWWWSGDTYLNDGEWTDRWNRRWPCTWDYYIPSVKDWSEIYRDRSIATPLISNNQWSKDLLLPPAWHLQRTNSRLSDQWMYWYYRASSPSRDSQAYEMHFDYNWINARYWSTLNSDWNSLRCFKDWKVENPLRIHMNWWWNVVIWVRWNIISSLWEPSHDIADFVWRYSSPNYEEENKLEEWDSVLWVSDIYALYTCHEWYTSSWETMCYKPYTELLPWIQFNQAIKKMVGDDKYYYNNGDTKVSLFKRTDILTWWNKVIISTEGSKNPVYAWFEKENGQWIVYYYSVDNEIFLNKDSSHMFQGFNWIEQLDLSWFNTEHVTNMSSMFNSCISLEEIDLQLFDTSNVIDMSNMFYYCLKLKRIDLSMLNLGNVESMKSMFEWCELLNDVNLSWIDTNKVTNFSRMFFWCNSLTIIDVSNLVKNSCERIDYMFAYSNNLEYVRADGWNLSNILNKNDRYGVFNQSKKLSRLSAKNWTIPVDFPSWIDDFEADSSLEWIDVTNWNLSNTVDISYVFYHQNNLKNIIWLNTWNTSNIRSMQGMFYSSPLLEVIDMSSFSSENLLNINNMFWYNDSIKTIYSNNNFLKNIPNKDSIYMFYTPSLVWWNWTIYNSSYWSYAQIDNQTQSWYFTDPNNFTVRFYDLNWNELWTQHIAVWENAEKIFWDDVKYYTWADKQYPFNFTKWLDCYTEVYVDWYKVTFHPNNWWDDIVKYISSDWNIWMAQVSVEKKWYIFDWWYDNPDFSWEPYDLSTAITNDISLYAKWTFNCDWWENYDEEYDVCYKSNKLTINYIYQDNSQAAPKYEVYLSSGSPYCVDSPIIDNYIATPLKQNGTIGFIATNLDVRYMPTNNGWYIDPIIIWDEEPILSIPNFWTLVTSSNTSGKTNKVTIHYQDEFWTKLFDDYSWNHTGLYTIKSPVSDNFDADQTLIKGMACWTDTEYTVVYKIKDTIQNEYEIKFIDGSVPYRKVVYTWSYWADLSNLTYPQNWTKKGYTISWDKTIPERMPLWWDIITASWVANTYKVSFNANQEWVENPSDMSVTYDTTYWTLPSLTKTGYNFNWWKDWDDFVTPYHIFTTDSDVTLIWDWSANSNTPYTVEYYYQESDGKYLSTPTNKNTSRVWTTDTSVSVTENDKIPVQSWYAFDIDNDNNVLEWKVLWNGSLKLKVYFKKQFTVKYLPWEKWLFAQQINENLDYWVLTPSFEGNTDNREEWYIFSWWNPEITETVTEDTIYIATWNEDKNKNGIADDKENPFTVKFLAWDNGELWWVKEFLVLSWLKLSDIEWYQIPVIIPNANYIFSWWSPVLDVNEKIQSNVNYTAIWWKDKNNNWENDEFEPKYTIIYTDWVDTGEIFKDQITENILSWIQTPEFSWNLTRLNYIFSWWNPSIIENVTWDVVYTAQWQDDMNNNGIADDLEEKYLITIKDWNTILATIELVSWVVISLPTPPSKIWYVFDGWSGLPADGKSVNKNLNITVKWRQINRNLSSAGGGFLSTLNNKNVFKDEKSHNSASLTWETQNWNKADEKNGVDMNDSNNKDNTEKWIQEQSTSTVNSNKEVFATSLQITYPEEIIDAYTWAKSKDITTIQTLDEAMPDGVVKRWHLAKMVVNYATNILWREIPEKIPSECRWNDNRKDWESEEIKDYAVKSCALWLMWLDMPKFLPNLDVTRAQFGTIMSRLLWWKKYAWWTPYYRKHLNALKENNIMTQLENPENRVELRQWVWLMLMRSAENK